MKGIYVLEEMERGGYMNISFGLARTIMERMVCIHSQSFSAYCFKIRQSNQFIVTQVTARFSGLCDFFTKLILNVLVDGKKI